MTSPALTPLASWQLDADHTADSGRGLAEHLQSQGYERLLLHHWLYADPSALPEVNRILADPAERQRVIRRAQQGEAIPTPRFEGQHRPGVVATFDHILTHGDALPVYDWSELRVAGSPLADLFTNPASNLLDPEEALVHLFQTNESYASLVTAWRGEVRMVPQFVGGLRGGVQLARDEFELHLCRALRELKPAADHLLDHGRTAWHLQLACSLLDHTELLETLRACDPTVPVAVVSSAWYLLGTTPVNYELHTSLEPVGFRVDEATSGPDVESRYQLRWVSYLSEAVKQGGLSAIRDLAIDDADIIIDLMVAINYATQQGDKSWITRWTEALLDVPTDTILAQWQKILAEFTDQRDRRATFLTRPQSAQALWELEEEAAASLARLIPIPDAPLGN